MLSSKWLLTVNQNPDSAKSDVMCRLVTYKGFLHRGDVLFCERLFLGRRDTKMSTYPKKKSPDRPQYRLHQSLTKWTVSFIWVTYRNRDDPEQLHYRKQTIQRAATDKNHIPGALCTAGRNNLLPQLFFSAPIILGEFPVNFGNVQFVYSWVSWAHPSSFLERMC